MDSIYFFYNKENYSFSIERGSDHADSVFCDDDSGWCILADARIDYIGELAEELGIAWALAEKYSDSRLILSAYLKWGEGCLEYIYGDFAFVIWHPERHHVFFARDHFGRRPLYYIDQPDFLAVASRTGSFRNIPDFKSEVREQYILDTICAIEITDDQSAYIGISRLMPAHYLNYSDAKLSEQFRYWELKIDKAYAELSLDAACQGLKERILESIRQRTPADCQIGVELSGGLDSSGIASVLVDQLDQNAPLFAFTHSISEEGAARQKYLKSELEYSEEIVNAFGAIRQSIVTEEHGEGCYTALVDALTILDKPLNQTFAMNSDLLIQKAGEQGIAVLFSGMGGDEGITNNGMGNMDELIRLGRHMELYKQLRRKGGGRLKAYKRLVKKYLGYYTPWLNGLCVKDWRKTRYRSFAIEKSLEQKYRMKRRYFSIIGFPNNADVRELQYFRLMHSNIPVRMEETDLIAHQHGIEYRYPFLDVKMVEFFYSLPSEYKYKEGQGRYLFRKAMEGILPDKVRLRIDKVGTTIPNVLARVVKDEEVFRELIEEGRSNNSYHYVDYDKLHGMLDTFKQFGDPKAYNFSPRTFLSPMSVLILQQWQREGRINVGIKC